MCHRHSSCYKCTETFFGGLGTRFHHQQAKDIEEEMSLVSLTKVRTLQSVPITTCTRKRYMGRLTSGKNLVK